MATRSLIGNYRSYIYCHWDGYPEHNGEILKKYYKDPKKVDELISLGSISVLAKNINPDPSKPHTFDNKQENVVVAYHRDRGEDWEDVKPKPMSKDFETNQHMVEYLYYFDEDKKLWRYKGLYEDNPEWIWLKDESFDRIVDNALKEMAREFVDNVYKNKLLGNICETIDILLKEIIKVTTIREHLESKLIVTYENKFKEYEEFQKYIVKIFAKKIKNQAIKEYLEGYNLNLYIWNNDMVRLYEYLHFFIKLDKAYNNIEQKELLDEVINDVFDYLPEIDDVKNYLENPDCAGGGVKKLVWYIDTVAFYKKYKDEINDLLADTLCSIGTYNVKDLFGDKWEEEDPLVTGCSNKNLLAWFGYEETAHRLYKHLFEEEN